MVISRKGKPSYIASNLRYLRKSAGCTLEDMVKILSLKGKSSYNAYEKDRAIPDIFKLMQLANFFNVSIEDLVYTDLEKVGLKTEPDTKMYYEIGIVPYKACAGYGKMFGDEQWIGKLKSVRIEDKPYGIARAFEIEGDSMEPELKDHTLVIAIKKGRNEIIDNQTYVVVTDEGYFCKNLSISDDGKTAYLISKNQEYKPKHINAATIKELWKVWRKNIPIE